MYSLDKVFSEFIARIEDREALNAAKSDPVFYFVYPPDSMLEIKKHLPRWISKIHEKGLKTKRVSLADLFWETIDTSGRWDVWLDLEGDHEKQQINEAVRDALRQNDAFINKLIEVIGSVASDTVVLLTEAELLHPYFRTRTIESRLHDKIEAPTVIFYPGERSGQYGLRFLGFYSEDSNYRSTIIGGV